MTKGLVAPRLVHRGHIAVSGLFFARDGAAERTSILELWESGARLYSVREGWLLALPNAKRLPASDCPAATLVRYGEVLSARPLSASELEELPAGRSLVIAVGGESVTLRLGEPTDPSLWIDEDCLEFEETVSLRAPTPSVPPAVPATASSVREALDASVEDPPPELAELQKAIAERGQGLGVGSAPRTIRSVLGGVLRVVGIAAAGAGQGLKRALAGIFEGAAVRAGGRPRETGRLLAPSPRQSPGRRVGVWQRLFEAVKRWAWRSRIGVWLGRQHGRYLAEVLELFERRDYQQALRRALPASKGGDGAEQTTALLPFGGRNALVLGAERVRGGTVPLEQELFALLRQTYRRAASDLEQRELYVESAFVLSELLEEDEEAVALLDRHGLFEKSAQLAEARHLSPGLIVRQWFRAGQRDRAILIARRDNAYQDAMARLRAWPELQRGLRLLWADYLAESGNYGAAVELLGQETEALRIAEAWLDRAVAAGGIVGARALVLKALQTPAAFEAVRVKLADLLDDERPDEAASRAEFGRELIKRLRTTPTLELRALARQACRSLLRDRAAGLNVLESELLRDLAFQSGDGALHADLPSLPRRTELSQLMSEPAPRVFVLPEGDIGPGRIWDAVQLGAGRILVAKGEAGCWLLSRAGKPIHHFDVPCEDLVISDHGSRALAVARRGDTMVVSLLDLSARRAARYADLPSGPFARSFGGSEWFVVLERQVHALDLCSKQVRSLWASAVLPERVVEIVRTPLQVIWQLGNGEIWEHQLAPGLRLRRRATPSERCLLAAGGSACAIVEADVGGERRIRIGREDGTGAFDVGTADGLDVRILDADQDWIVIRVRRDESAVVDVLAVARAVHRPVLHLRLEGVHQATARLRQGTLLIADDGGRIELFELTCGARCSSLRV